MDVLPPNPYSFIFMSHVYQNCHVFIMYLSMLSWRGGGGEGGGRAWGGDLTFLSYFEKNSSYVSGVSVCIFVVLYLCIFVSLYVWMFVARANKVEGTMS